MRKLLTCAPTLALMLVGALSAAAQDMKPVAIVSLAGYDKVMSDFDALGEISGNPGLGRLAEGMLRNFTQGQGLNGIDKQQPWGVAVMTDGNQFVPVTFLPVTDLDALFAAFAGMLPAPQDAGDGMKELQMPNGDSLFIKQQGNWAFFARSAEQLANVPNNPAALLDGLNTQYAIAVRAYVQNIPEMYRSMAIEQFRRGMQGAQEREPGEDDQAYELRRNMMQLQAKQIETMAEELDTLTLGFAVDATGKTANLDVAVTAIPNSKIAAQFAQMADTTTDFAGFLMPNSAVSFNMSGKMTADDIEQTVTTLKALRVRAENEIENDPNLPDDQMRADAKAVLADFFDIVQKTVESGKMDCGGVLMLEPGAAALAVGGYVADSAAVEPAVRKLAELARNEPGFPGVKFNAASHGNINLHTMNVPLNDEDAQEVFGDTLEVYVGAGGQAVYASLGKGSLDLLKQVIDRNQAEAGKSVSPMQLAVSLGPIFKFAASQEQNPRVEMISAELAKVPGQDRVLVTAKAIPQGASYRIQLEEGVIKVLGQMGAMMGGMAGPGF